MSYVENNEAYIALSTGDYHGIKPIVLDWNTGIELPFSLTDMDEVKKLENQFKELFPKTYKWSKSLIASMTEKPHLYSSKKESKIYIEPSENSIAVTHMGKKGQVLMDTALRNTILGKKFKEYVKEKENVSDDEAQEILEKITPLARV